ncbi:hypothetical protein [Micromonospora sp. NBC_01412]|uniref:hypothetical protein n=1 Tax=Micromonospora sp. NBC_01412 TaxID=2903590 RepID=UPI003245BEB3
MNDILDPPAERDLPPARAARMRADLHQTLRGRPTRSVRLRLAAATVAVLLAGVGVAATLEGEPGAGGAQVLAMGRAELSGSLLRAARQCLTWTKGGDSSLTLDDLAVAVERGDRAMVLFMSDAGYLTCEVTRQGGGEPSGGSSHERWPRSDWLPGPVQRLLLTSSEPRGGDVAVSGRVSARVHRLVLDHGDGRTTTARISRGAFGLVTHARPVTGRAELVSYDAAGGELDRRPLFRPSDRFDHCYATPSGEVIYGPAGTDCRPAERWTR